MVLVAAFIPILWFFLMHDYQRQRVMMLLDPETDPLGAGYHIIQSKIAIGSGGLRGKGWLHGTQSQLEFTAGTPHRLYLRRAGRRAGADWCADPAGALYSADHAGAVDRRPGANHLGRVMAGGLMLILFVYVFVNIGMVSGILPVVGVPLPLVSYGAPP